LFDLHEDGPRGFRKYVRMQTVIILATVAFGAVRLVLRRLAPPQQLEWTADE